MDVWIRDDQPDLGSLAVRFFITSFLSFSLPSWAAWTFVLWLIEKDKPKEARSNALLFLGIGFILLLFF